MGFNLSSIEDYVANHLRMFILSVIGLVIFVGIIAVTVFFIAVRGEEQTMVPNVIGKELTEAMLELQLKELYPRIQLRYTHTSRDKGFILEQEPSAGTIVKAGRRIKLVVSQGVILDRVEDYINRNIDEVRMELLSLQAASGGAPLLTIKDPMESKSSTERPGTILEQKPDPNTPVSGPVTLVFVVSSGRDNQNVTVPQLTGLQYSQALDIISGTGINFKFTVREKTGSETAETVTAQQPAANTSVPSNTVVQITVTSPEKVADNERFGLFSYTMPQNPYPLPVRLAAILPSGTEQRILSVNYMGGDFTAPYKLPVGSTLVLTMTGRPDRELYRETIQ